MTQMDFESLKGLSLKQLSDRYPAVWQDVAAGLKERVSGGRADQLLAWRQGALGDLQNARRIGQFGDPAAASTAVKAQMTLLAIEQFCDVMSGRAGVKPRLRDVMVMNLLLLARLKSGHVFSTDGFDRVWRWMRDPIWAASELQRQGVWSVPTQELAEKIAGLCQGRRVLEIGAGNGLLCHSLKSQGLEITAVDDESWSLGGKLIRARGAQVLTRDAVEALKEYSPDVVICSWAPVGNAFEREIFRTKSVHTYLAISSRHSFASGNWGAYQEQQTFNCSTSEPLNSLIRPIEIEQQLLIFRRKISD
jgi:hypothetical protein